MSNLPRSKEITCDKVLTFEIGVGKHIQILWINGEVTVQEITDPYVTREKINAYIEKQKGIVREAEHKLELSERDKFWTDLM